MISIVSQLCYRFRRMGDVIQARGAAVIRLVEYLDDLPIDVEVPAKVRAALE